MGIVENYKKRVSGTIAPSLKEYVKTQVRTTLDTFLETSQYGMDVLVDGKEERIGIMTGGMSDTRDEILVLSKPGVLKMGTLFEWESDFWIVVKREVRVIKESFYGTAYRCNIDLKWVDKDGQLFSQKAYAKGRGLSSVLVENKYTAPPIMSREVDTPITVITQFNQKLEQEMRFLFASQPYRVTFVDSLSVDGATILGMYDDILHDGDDVINNIADYNKKYTIELAFKEEDVILEMGKPFEVKYDVLLNGEIVESKDILIKGEANLISIEGNVITPLVEGDIPLIICLAQNELINTSFVIHSGTEQVVDNTFIIGPDQVAWNNKAFYELNTQEDAEFTAEVKSKVKRDIEITPKGILISIGDKYSGVINITATTATDVYTKTIEIVSMGV